VEIEQKQSKKSDDMKCTNDVTLYCLTQLIKISWTLWQLWIIKIKVIWPEIAQRLCTL